MDNQLTPFEGTEIRKLWHDEQWYFSIVDVITALTDTTNPTSYWSKTQKKIKSESEFVPFWHKLKLAGKDGKKYASDCANTEGVFRIIMSVPSPKAEPLRLWLASLGKQALDEAENPELLTNRQAELYRAKGYTEEWIGKRVQTIEIRKELTDEWQQRGVKEGQEYAILTATIAKGTFGLTPTEHKDLKGLDRQNLRDHMTPIELIFTALGEEATRQITLRDNAQGFSDNHEAAQIGGRIGGKARGNYEEESGLKVVSNENFLGLKGGESAKELLTDKVK